MLSRYKENKILQKEKEKREKEKKGVFKVGLYKPQPLGYLPSNIAAPGRGKVSDGNISLKSQSQTIMKSTSGAFKSCRIDRIYGLIAHEVNATTKS